MLPLFPQGKAKKTSLKIHKAIANMLRVTGKMYQGREKRPDLLRDQRAPEQPSPRTAHSLQNMGKKPLCKENFSNIAVIKNFTQKYMPDYLVSY